MLGRWVAWLGICSVFYPNVSQFLVSFFFTVLEWWSNEVFKLYNFTCLLTLINCFIPWPLFGQLGELFVAYALLDWVVEWKMHVQNYGVICMTIWCVIVLFWIELWKGKCMSRIVVVLGENSVRNCQLQLCHNLHLFSY